MLSTQETVSGLRKVTTVIDALVKQFPQYTHKRVAEILLEEFGKDGKALVQLRKEIELMRADKKNPFQKVGSLARLVKYEPIFYDVADMIEAIGKTYVAPIAQPVVAKAKKAPAKSKAKATVAKPVIVADATNAAPAVRPVALLAHVVAKAA